MYITYNDFMLLVPTNLKKLLIYLFPSFPDLVGESRETGLDYPVKPDNDNHWNSVRCEEYLLKIAKTKSF